MPLTIERPAPRPPAKRSRERRRAPRLVRAIAAGALAIGLVNNMPDAARRGDAAPVRAADRRGERRFRRPPAPVRARDAAARAPRRVARWPRLSRPPARSTTRSLGRAHRHRRRTARRRPARRAVLGRTRLRPRLGAPRTPSRRCFPASPRTPACCSATASSRRPLAAQAAPASIAVDVVADHELVAGLEPRYRDAAFALQRPRRGGARRKGLSHAGALAGMRRRPVRPQGAQPAGLPAGPSRNTRPTRWRANTAATCCASCAARRRRRRTPPAHYYPPAAAAAVGEFRRAARWRRPKRRSRRASPSRPCRSTTSRGAQAGVQLVHNWLGLVARRKAARSAATFAVARWGG